MSRKQIKKLYVGSSCQPQTLFCCCDSDFQKKTKKKHTATHTQSFGHGCSGSPVALS